MKCTVIFWSLIGYMMFDSSIIRVWSLSERVRQWDVNKEDSVLVEDYMGCGCVYRLRAHKLLHSDWYRTRCPACVWTPKTRCAVLLSAALPCAALRCSWCERTRRIAPCGPSHHTFFWRLQVGFPYHLLWLMACECSRNQCDLRRHASMKFKIIIIFFSVYMKDILSSDTHAKC